MFLALKEIKREKLRYGLIISMIVLIAYLIFVLTSLALGLAQENTQVIDSWHIKRIVLDKDSDINLSQSLITKKELSTFKLSRKDAYIGQASIVVKSKGNKKESAQFIGLDKHQFIFKNIKLLSGRKAASNREIVVDEQFKDDGYRLGEKVSFNSFSGKYQIVGFTKGAKLSVAPVVYGTLSAWKKMQSSRRDFKASAVVSQSSNFEATNSQLKSYSSGKFINQLPGYSAQNSTFTFMIAFLMIISLIVIAVFLYILTIQKIKNYAVLRAQGIPAKILVIATICQSAILVVSGLIIAALLTILTAVFIPTAVPMSFNLPILLSVAVGLIITGLIGALIPARIIVRINPISVIGE